MSHVDFKNGNVPGCYLCNFDVYFKIAVCRLSNLEEGPCHVGNIFSNVDKLYVTCRF